MLQAYRSSLDQANSLKIQWSTFRRWLILPAGGLVGFQSVVQLLYCNRRGSSAAVDVDLGVLLQVRAAGQQYRCCTTARSSVAVAEAAQKKESAQSRTLSREPATCSSISQQASKLLLTSTHPFRPFCSFCWPPGPAFTPSADYPRTGASAHSLLQTNVLACSSDKGRSRQQKHNMASALALQTIFSDTDVEAGKGRGPQSSFTIERPPESDRPVWQLQSVSKWARSSGEGTSPSTLLEARPYKLQEEERQEFLEEVAVTGAGDLVDRNSGKAERRFHGGVWRAGSMEDSQNLARRLLTDLEEASRQRLQIVDTLDSWKDRAGSGEVTLALKIARGSGSLQSALSLFTWANSQPHLGNDPFLLATGVAVLGDLGLLEYAQQVFRSGIRHTPVWNAMMGVYLKAGLLADLIDLFKKMSVSGDEERGVQSEIDQGVQAECGPVRDTSSYNLAMEAVAASGLGLSELRKLWVEMQRQGLKPDRVTYNSMLGACASMVQRTGSAAHQAKGLRRVLEVLADMQANRIQPDARSYSTVLKACRLAGSHQAAMDVYDMMVEDSCQWTSHVYQALISALGTSGQLAEAEAVFKELLKSGSKPNLACYHAMASAYARMGRAEAVEACIREIQAQGFQLSSRSTAILAEAYSKAKEVTKLAQLLDSDAPLGVEAWTVSLKTLAATAKMSVLAHVLQRMHVHGLAPNVITYTSLLTALARKQDWEGVSAVFDALRTFSEPPQAPPGTPQTCDSDHRAESTRALSANSVLPCTSEAGSGTSLRKHDMGTAHARLAERGETSQRYTTEQEAFAEPSCTLQTSQGVTHRMQDLVDPTIERIASHASASSTGINHISDPRALPRAFHADLADLLVAELSPSQVRQVLGRLWRGLEGESESSVTAFTNALMEALWSFGWHRRAGEVAAEGMREGLYRSLTKVGDGTWSIDLRHLGRGGAEAVLRLWVLRLHEDLVQRNELELPEEIVIVTGWPSSRPASKGFLQRVIWRLLDDLGSPFVIPADGYGGQLVAECQSVLLWLEDVRVRQALRLLDHGLEEGDM